MKLSPFAAAACAGLLVSPLGAQEKADSNVDSGLKFTAGYAYSQEVDITQNARAAAADSDTLITDAFATNAYAAQVDLFTKLDDGSLITLYGAYKVQQFDYAGAGLQFEKNFLSTSATAEQLDETTAFSFGTDTLLKVYEGFGLLVTGDMDIPKTNLGTYRMGENFNVGGGVTYSLSDRLTVGAGAIYYGQAQEDDMVLPLVYADWQVNDRLSVLLYYPETAGVDFSFDQDRNHIAGLSFNWVKETYSSNGKSGGSSGSEQVLVDEYYSVQLDYTWQPTAWFSIQPYVAYSLERSWEIWGDWSIPDPDGSGPLRTQNFYDTKVYDFDVEDGLTFGLNLTLKW